MDCTKKRMIEACARRYGRLPGTYRFITECLDFIFASRLEVGRSKGNYFTSVELCRGITIFALDEFGLLAHVVLRHLGLANSDALGLCIEEMSTAGILTLEDGESADSFRGVISYQVDEFDEIYDDYLGDIAAALDEVAEE
ncbi:MAG: hypothetical protein Q8P45_02855 [Candidatus Harrisonbacteria bacterium]|nr:hypothetical protein [Candidatus Harrisonbacteria bacterium]